MSNRDAAFAQAAVQYRPPEDSSEPEPALYRINRRLNDLDELLAKNLGRLEEALMRALGSPEGPAPASLHPVSAGSVGDAMQKIDTLEGQIGRLSALVDRVNLVM